jgi:predicted amidophosphoribosyltransferase
VESAKPAGEEKTTCRCPFCDNALVMPYPFCQVCGAVILYCPECGQPMPRDAEVCPYCSGEADRPPWETVV